MFSDASKRRGFTLLEVVCTLIILGVLGGMVFSGFSSALTGYAQMRASTATYMQAELALIRLRKELADVFETFLLDEREKKTEGSTLSFRRADGATVRLYIENKVIDKKTEINLMLEEKGPLEEKSRSAPLLGGVGTVKEALFKVHYPDGSALPDLITVTFTLDAPAGPKTYSLAVSPRNTPPAGG